MEKIMHEGAYNDFSSLSDRLDTYTNISRKNPDFLFIFIGLINNLTNLTRNDSKSLAKYEKKILLLFILHI